VTVTVTDSDDNTDTKDLSLEIAYPVQITTETLPDGTVGVAYSAQVDATQGRSPYTWYGTDLPPGLSISSGNASSTISGTPTEAETYDCHVSVTDSGNSASNSTDDSKTYTITIAAAPLSITTTTLPDGFVDNNYVDDSGGTISVQATGGTPPYTFSCDESTLPPGLSLASDGVVSGTPTDEGDYSINVTVEDSASSDDPAPQQANTDTKNIAVKIKSFQITGPDAIGVVKDQSTATTQVYTVTVADGIDPTKIDVRPIVVAGGGLVTVTKKNQTGNTITFEVKGNQQSKSEKDVILQIVQNGNPLASPTKQLSVVVPYKFANLTNSTEAVVPEHRAFTRYSTPAWDFTAAQQVAGVWCVKGVFWGRILSMTVHDQFGHELGNLYDGAEITEQLFDVQNPEQPTSGIYPINQQLNNGVYSDPSGLTQGVSPHLPQLPLPTDKQWILDHTPPTELLHGAELEEAGTVTIPEQTVLFQVKVG